MPISFITSWRNSGKMISLSFLITCTFTLTAVSQIRPAVYPPNVTGVESMKKDLEPLLRMTVEELISHVPSESGIFFVGCPNCNGGAQEKLVLRWELGMGDKVRCTYCKMVFPNEKFPNNRENVIIAPSGIKQVYRYHENPEGRQFYFEPHAWYERWLWIQQKAVQLASVWYATKDNDYGDRAAVIAGRFAKVFPDYAVRYDYPGRPKRFFPANQKWPYEGIPSYRGAKWDWWGVMDISAPMANVYDILKSGYDWKRMDKFIGPETDKRIAKDLLKLGVEFTTANPEGYGNMEPGMYRNMIRVGRVINDPAIVYDAVRRFREFLSRGFFADGWWMEGSPGYHRQSVDNLRMTADVLKGYTDPPDWKGERLDNLNLTQGLPLFEKAIRVRREAVLPNGRVLPINDVWATGRISDIQNPGHTVSRLWPSLGNASLGHGEGDNQIMLNVNWSGNYGHSHSDNGSIILFAAGQELLSDIGYTHSKYRGWTLTTVSHNTVVIDQKDQDSGMGDDSKSVTGNLKFYDDGDPHVKVIDLDASPAYQISKTYRRRLVLVNAGPGRDYVVDRFDVEGGKDHDWLLHGMLEEEGTLETSILMKPLSGSLAPDWGGKEPPKAGTDTNPKRFNHPYTYLRDMKTAATGGMAWTATWRYQGGVGLRSHNLSASDMQVISFRSPSVRPAEEQDNKLDDFMHNGIMLRNSGKASTFLAVHEPFRNEPWIESVENAGNALLIKYKLNGVSVEDRIFITDGQITVSSSAGWKYNSGTARTGKVEGLQTAGGKYRLQLDKDAPKVSFVRLDLSDGSTRYYPVASVQGKTLELVDDPGFTIGESGKIVFHTFPKDQHEGPLQYTLFEQ